MKKADIYEIAIKLLGLYLVLEVINQLSQNVTYFIVWRQQILQPEMGDMVEHTPLFVLSVLTFLAVAVICWLLIFKTRSIAQLISAPEDTEEEVKLLVDRQSIFEIALVLMGLVVLVWNVPDFIYRLKHMGILSNSDVYLSDYDRSFFAIAGLKSALGLVAIVFSIPLSRLLTRKGRAEGTDE